MERGVCGVGCIDGRRSVGFRRYDFGGCGRYIFRRHVLGVFGGYYLGGGGRRDTLINALVEVGGFFVEGCCYGIW